MFFRSNIISLLIPDGLLVFVNMIPSSTHICLGYMEPKCLADKNLLYFSVGLQSLGVGL